MDTELVLEFLVSLLPSLYFLLAIAFLDMLSGALVAVKFKEFKWEKLPEFLLQAFGYLLGWFTIEILTALPAFLGLDLSGLLELLSGYTGNAIFLFISGKYITSVLGHLLALGVLPGKDTFRSIGIPPTTQPRT